VLVRLLLVPALGRLEVALETGAKVHGADDGVRDGKNEEQDGDDGEGCQRPLHSRVSLLGLLLVDAHQLEQEPREGAKAECDGEHHAGLVLVPDEDGGQDEQNDGDGDGGRCHVRLDIRLSCHDDEELNDEAEEEEEIDLKERDVDLGRG